MAGRSLLFPSRLRVRKLEESECALTMAMPGTALMIILRRLPILGLFLATAAIASDAPAESPVGSTFQVPYRVTLTNHYLVRVRINGQGPFNFLVDTGAPALYVGTEAAKRIHLEPSRRSYWTDIEQLELEGGALLRHLKARIEDPVQLIGMNEMGLPGARIDGILGFTVLARFRMEFDPTKDRMTWTRLDYEPKEPPVPGRSDRELPPELQMMNLLGPVAKFLGLFLKQPEEQLHPRGFLGLEVNDRDGQVRVSTVLPGTAAAKAGLKAGDRLVQVGQQEISSFADAWKAMAEVKPGDRVTLTVRRGPGTMELIATAAEGL